MSIKDLRAAIFSDKDGKIRVGLKQANTKKRTVYWLSGKRDVLEGTSLIDALQKEGHNHASMTLIDFVENGEDNSWIWNDGKWVKKAGT